MKSYKVGKDYNQTSYCVSNVIYPHTIADPESDYRGVELITTFIYHPLLCVSIFHFITFYINYTILFNNKPHIHFYLDQGHPIVDMMTIFHTYS